MNRHILVQHGDNADDTSIYALLDLKIGTGVSYILSRSNLDPGWSPSVVGEVIAALDDNQSGVVLHVGKRKLSLNYGEFEAVLALLTLVDKQEECAAQFFEIKKI